jgi:hypothetical protein
MVITAIDPGEIHCGVAVLVTDQYVSPYALSPDRSIVDQSADRKDQLVYATEFTQTELFDWVERYMWAWDRLVIERFQLYPWMSRQQGYSEFGTAQAIGVLKYIARKSELEIVMQDASGCKRKGRKKAADAGFRMVDRKLGSGKYVYYGPDFAAISSSHARDAAAHACYYGLTDGQVD